MLPDKSHPFAAATVLLRTEKGAIYRESLSEIEDVESDLDWGDEESGEWEPPGSSSPPC